MRWILSLFNASRGPIGWRELPVELLKVSIWGAITGPLFSFFFQTIFQPWNLGRLLLTPQVWYWSATAGPIFAICFWLPCGLGNSWLRRWLDGYPVSIRMALFAVFNAIGCSLAFATAGSLVSRLPGGVHFEMPYFWSIVIVDGIIGALLALIIGAFKALKSQVVTAQTTLREREVNERRLAEAAARAQALSLQAQINPHFFFNTLNTISALIEIDPAAAQLTLGRLSDMFRYTLNCSQAEAVQLEQEVQFVRDYLSIEQARYRNRLVVEYPDGPIPDIAIPGLLLQPLVENAIKHGIAKSLDGGTVQIRISLAQDAARICIRNTDEQEPDLAPAQLFRPGHALENVRSRLRLFTGQSEPLDVRRAGNWTEMSFAVPKGR